MPSWRAAALMRLIQRRRKSRLRLRRSRYAYASALNIASFARLYDELASPRKPLVRSRTSRRFFLAWTERLTRVIGPARGAVGWHDARRPWRGLCAAAYEACACVA